ncbi:phosphodiesterase [Burkholderia plantarii]|uniref:phosphodiesterase n=1 Tax=Burkholderia plantarii TaxID=41899 RepID=UPI0006D8BD63|nr:phosphodiesterase [Burkholderia plantarii]ALK33290.1 3',5'-cyclic-nucleotide phosphodiesterase [Burkholderia plantarii]GLZ22277.1 3',5'-cyclic adenosine monophosphate phosphodiesterase CpdA [Burkholderia plantarii]
MTIIAQISDVHVRPEGVLYQDAVDSNAMLERAIASLNALVPRPDLVLVTGDLTDEGKPEEYAMLRRLLAPLAIPFAVMPGNHDHRDNLRRAFADHAYLPPQGPLHYAIDVGAVRIIALDTSVPGWHHGGLDSHALDWLDAQLRACRDRPTMVAMHHPPFDTGIPYLDIYGLRDIDRFTATLAAHSHVERVVAGHVHRSMQTRVGNVPVVTCPSTVTQIALRTLPDAQPASYLEPPAFLLHYWTPGKPSICHLSHVGRFEGPYPFA